MHSIATWPDFNLPYMCAAVLQHQMLQRCIQKINLNMTRKEMQCKKAMMFIMMGVLMQSWAPCW